MGFDLPEEYLKYDDGKLYWEATVNRRSARKGDQAGTLRKDGYRTITFDGIKYLEHRLIFFYFHRKWPIYVDHIDKDKSNNRIENLRDVTPYGNSINRKDSRDYPGVSLHHGKYQVIIKGVYYGRFKTEEEAIQCKDGVCGI